MPGAEKLVVSKTKNLTFLFCASFEITSNSLCRYETTQSEQRGVDVFSQNALCELKATG